MIKQINASDLRCMNDSEGLILQGCGGDLDGWLDWINELLTEEGILLDGDKFDEATTFKHDGVTNLLFNVNGVKLDVGKLAMWRLRSHETFGGTWLSDYVPNRLDGFFGEEAQDYDFDEEEESEEFGGISM